MKNTKKILVVVLAVILVMAFAVPAFAAGTTGEIQVTGAEGSTTSYDVYRIFDTEEVSGGYKYKLTSDWTGFTAEGYFTVNENGYVIWEKNTNSVADAAAIAQKAKLFAIEKGLVKNYTVKVGETISVDPGYYLLVPAAGPCGVVMVDAGVKSVVEEKTTAAGHPVVEKLVQEDSTNTYGKLNNADIGQTIKFQTAVTVGVNAEKYVLHDAMDDHIAFTNDIEILRDGNAVPATNNYTIEEDPADGCTFHIVFSDSFCKSLAEDATLIIRYTGKLEADSEEAAGALVNEKHENKTWITYTSDAVPSNESFTETETYKITVKKVDQDNNPLDGAGFILRDNIGLYYSFDDATNAVKWIELADDEAKKAAAKITDENGVIEFIGVDAENFTLEEVIVPDGYTGTTDVSVSTKNGSTEVTVKNTLGTELPETGGMGTTVFYIVGIALVVGALIAVFAIKRKKASNQ